MAGIFDSLVKGFVELAPQDDPGVKQYRAKNELDELTEKETALYAALGKRAYADGGKEKYPDLTLRLEAFEAARVEIEQRILDAQAQQAEQERIAAARAEAEAQQPCPACGTMNSEDKNFCQACGAKLITVQRCTSCGADIAPGVRFCGECGAEQEI
ncbi:MAG: zinc ribbon domain-containing protein [Candidatus Pelethousia sp.]|nr:zinc ribbon domain-containing protein [Candidatus Pelethousia sp.]